MKFFRSVTVTPEHCPQDLYAQIVRMRPEAQRGSIFHLEAKPGDEESTRLVEQIAALCERRGLGEVRGACSHLLLPRYDASDLRTAPLLWLRTQRKMFHDTSRVENGRLCLPAGQTNANVKVGSIYPKPWIVVSDAVRHTLLDSGLPGPVFSKICLRGRSIHASDNPLWELRSSVLLPKMANSIPTEDDLIPGYTIADNWGEPHYSERDLKRVGPIGLGRTFEALQAGEPWLVISQQLYQHCLKHNIRFEASPMRVDPS
jgi:hypothetical protein